MKKIEKYFDINMVLMRIYIALEAIRKEEDIELVYDIDATIPKELQGDVESVAHVLTQLLIFVFQNTPNHEVTLNLRAPKDFLYRESITFSIEETGIGRDKALSFFKARLKPILDRVDARATYEEESAKITVAIPFRLHDLGNRRYYRLPNANMLKKNVLLISKSKIVSDSIRKMFKYFLYEVDEGAEAYKKRGSNLAIYDIFVLEDSLLTPGIETLVQKVQEEHDLKFVILQEADKAEVLTQKQFISAYLVKPVMQESIFELIIALFEGDIEERKIKKEAGKPVINMEKYILDAFRKSEETYVQMEKIKEEMMLLHQRIASSEVKEDMQLRDNHLKVLNIDLGKEKTKKAGLDYSDELKKFLDKFNRSDIYFRDIAKSKAVWQIKEFAIDLKKYASLIGAERIANLAEKISFLFVYDNLDMLPVYTEKYHMELQKLFKGIDTHLEKTP